LSGHWLPRRTTFEELAHNKRAVEQELAAVQELVRGKRAVERDMAAKEDVI
jgi:uncharacterized protein (DUF3084 family)